MNIFEKIYCRVYQGVIYLVFPFLRLRKPELIVGNGASLEIPKLVKENKLGKPMIVTSKDLVNLKLLDPLFSKLDDEKVPYYLYDDVTPNPTISMIETGVIKYNENSCTSLIAFGGGSPIDCAKGIGARIAKPKKSISKMKGILKIQKKLPTIIAVPTTAGTGSEATLATVITDEKTHDKYPINDPNLVPRYAILDPSLTVGLPKGITSTTGMDALTHAVEAYIGRGNTKETKSMAIKTVQLVHENLLTAYKEGTNIIARENMLLAAHYGGIAFTRAYVGYVHAIAHSLGGMYGIPHGLANAIILPYVLEYYGESAHKKLAELATAVGIVGISDKEKAERFIQWIKDMNESLKIPTKISEIKEDDIIIMAKRALKEANPLYPVPKFMGLREITQIYKILMG
ncbi:MAG TPA: iron-containing alcohol dehydrogenase [Clostridia bacterium]|jgi:alcohol dehydrogenase class IV|nr:iron-containing alcohol dehydrogenase [Clostridia bacterium]